MFKYLRRNRHWRERGGDPHLTSALGAVVHGPLVSVLADDAVVDTDATVDANAGFNQLVFIRLWKRETGKMDL